MRPSNFLHRSYPDPFYAPCRSGDWTLSPQVNASFGKRSLTLLVQPTIPFVQRVLYLCLMHPLDL